MSGEYEGDEGDVAKVEILSCGSSNNTSIAAVLATEVRLPVHSENRSAESTGEVEPSLTGSTGLSESFGLSLDYTSQIEPLRL